MSISNAWQLLPRVSELRTLSVGHPNQYFDQSEPLEPEGLRWQVWATREKHLQKLDSNAWEFFKTELAQKVVEKDQLRGWAQLISSLNESFAYSYLSSAGYKTIQFIPRSKKKNIKTPDLHAYSPCGKETVCEVKTIHRSDVEVQKQRMANERQFCGATGTSSPVLEEGFYKKLFEDVDKAIFQCETHAPKAEHIVFIVMSFDDWTGENKESYFAEMDRRLDEKANVSAQLIFCNLRTPFHPKIQMKNAEVLHWDC